MQMYHNIQRIEEEGHAEKLLLNLRFRNNEAESPTSWNSVAGEIDKEWFHIDENTIPILRPITGRLKKEQGPCSRRVTN